VRVNGALSLQQRLEGVVEVLQVLPPHGCIRAGPAQGALLHLLRQVGVYPVSPVLQQHLGPPLAHSVGLQCLLLVRLLLPLLHVVLL
jgi:hypothetical protein